MRILIDENLSPTLVQKLASVGLFAQHIVRVGRAGLADEEVWTYAYEHDFVVATLNAGDFLQLAGTSDVHPGLIVLREAGLTATQQWDVLESVIAAVRQLDLTNRVVEVFAADDFEIREIPSVAE